MAWVRRIVIDDGAGEISHIVKEGQKIDFAPKFTVETECGRNIRPKHIRTVCGNGWVDFHSEWNYAAEDCRKCSKCYDKVPNGW